MSHYYSAGSINLNTCLSVVSSSVPVKNFKYVFDVSTTERVYHLAADSEKERSEWVSTLKELLFPSSKVCKICFCMSLICLFCRMESIQDHLRHQSEYVSTTK